MRKAFPVRDTFQAVIWNRDALAGADNTNDVLKAAMSVDPKEAQGRAQAQFAAEDKARAAGLFHGR